MTTEHTYTESEEKIFRAALEVFSEAGRSGARLQEIADRAGVNKALIHYYFRSKERLYEEVFVFIIRRYFKRIAEALEGDGSFEDLLRRFIDDYLTLLHENPALPIFLLREISSGADIMVGKMRELMLPDRGAPPAIFLRRYREAVEAGEIRDVGASQTMISIMGACIYYFAGYPLLSIVLPDLQQPPGAYLEQRKQHLFDLMFYGLKPREDMHA